MDKKRTFGLLTRRYTVWYLVFFCVCIVPFLCARGYSFFGPGDGLNQRLNYYVYIGTWVKKFAANIFIDHNMEMPMWDMSIGMGDDPLGVIVMGGGHDLLSLVSAFIPLRYAEISFDILLAIRLYLAGLSYSIFAYHKGRSIDSIVAGAMVYCFSAVIYIVFIQSGFLPFFCCFPLLLLGVDRLWQGKGHLLYVIMLVYAMTIATYFTFIAAILIVVYCVIRFFSEEERSIKRFVTLFIRFMVFSVIAVCIGLVFELPSIMTTAGLDRIDRSFTIPMFSVYNMILMISHAFSCAYMGGDATFGISAIAVIGLLCLFDKKDNRRLKWLFVIYTVSFVFPVVGAVFHLMKYPTARYVFGYDLLIAYIVTCTYDDLPTLSRKKRLGLLLGALIYVPIALVLGRRAGMFSAVSLIVTVISYVIIVSLSERKTLNSNRWYMVPVMISCILVSAFSFYDSSVFTMLEAGSAYNENYELLERADLDKDEMKNVRYSVLYRVVSDTPTNVSMVYGTNGYDYYNSNCNPYVSDYYTEMGVNSSATGFMFTGFRGRSFLDITGATRYVFRKNDKDTCISAPYGYELIASNDDLETYQSVNDVSMVYFCDDVISSDYYQESQPIDREEMVMRSIVLEGAAGGGTEDMTPGHSVCDHSLVASGDISYTGNDITVGPEGGYLELSVDEITDSELSLFLDDLIGEHVDADYYIIAVAKCYQDTVVRSDYYTGLPIQNTYYCGKDDLLFNLGYTEEPIDTIRIYFITPGRYTINDIKVYTRSEEQLDSVISSFYEHADMDSVEYEYDGNHINAQVVSDKDQYLYFAVPYSEGWRATVDGEAVDILRANTAFMAIPVSQGAHTVELSYTTPYLMRGACMSAVAIVVYAGILAVEHRKKRERKI